MSYHICPQCGGTIYDMTVVAPFNHIIAYSSASTNVCPGHFDNTATYPSGGIPVQYTTTGDAEPIAELWHIVEEVATKSAIYLDRVRNWVCLFCNGKLSSDAIIDHEDDCIVTKARKLIEQKRQ